MGLLLLPPDIRRLIGTLITPRDLRSLRIINKSFTQSLDPLFRLQIRLRYQNFPRSDNGKYFVPTSGHFSLIHPEWVNFSSKRLPGRSSACTSFIYDPSKDLIINRSIAYSIYMLGFNQIQVGYQIWPGSPILESGISNQDHLLATFFNRKYIPDLRMLYWILQRSPFGSVKSREIVVEEFNRIFINYKSSPSYLINSIKFYLYLIVNSTLIGILPPSNEILVRWTVIDLDSGFDSEFSRRIVEEINDLSVRLRAGLLSLN
jgi:hypothetical protein